MGTFVEIEVESPTEMVIVIIFILIIETSTAKKVIRWCGAYYYEPSVTE
jgi:hypothetical protein